MLNDDIIARLKAVDPDRYRSTLFADKPARAKLLTLYAFHAELAKVPELVSEPLLGEIRYQWWRDCIEQIYSNGVVRAHEVATPLTQVLRGSAIPRSDVDRLIDGRARDLNPEPFANIDAVRGYARQTSGMLMQMSARLLGGETDEAWLTRSEAWLTRDEALLAGGEAWGLTGMARSWRYYKDGMLSAVSYADICAAAKDAHRRAKPALDGLPPAVFPAVAYAALVPRFLTRLTESGHDFALQSVQYAPVLKQLRLMGAVMTGRI